MPIPGAAPAPQQISPAPAAGPAAVPQGNPGNTQAALAKIKTAVELLQQALPSIPMGTPLHADVLDCTKKLAKNIGDKGGNESNQIQALLSAVKNAQQQAPMGAMARMFPQGGAPAMPAPAGAAA